MGKFTDNRVDADADQIHKKYISVLADLTREDAVVFRALCQKWFDAEKPPKALTYGATVDGIGSHNAISIITLNRLGLISPGYINFISYELNEDRSFKNPEPFSGNDVTAYGNLEAVEVTNFGVAFYKAVLADQD